MRNIILCCLILYLCFLQADVFRYLNTARIVYFNERDYERAKGACLEGIKNDPDNFELFAILGGAEMGLGNWRGAAIAFEQAFTIDTSKTLGWITKQAEGAKYYFQAFYFCARDLFEEESYAEVLHYLDYERVFGIKDINTYVLRGAALYKLERYEEANNEYMRVLNLDPDNADINFLIGKSLFDNGEFGDCLECFSKAIRNYQMQYERVGRVVFQNLLGIDSTLAQQIVILWADDRIRELDSLVEDALGFPEGLAVQGAKITQFAEAADDLGRSYYFLGMAYYNLESDTLALNSLIQSLRYKPNDVDALYFAGEMNVRLHRYDAAIPHLERLTAQCPDDQYGWFYLGVCYTETKQYKKAVDAYENKVLQLDPDNTDVMNNLAYVYGELGDSEKALYWLIKAEEINKNR